MSCRIVLTACLVTISVAQASPPSKTPADVVYWLPTTVGDTLVREQSCPTADSKTTRVITSTVLAVEWQDRVVSVTIKYEEDGVPAKVSAFAQMKEAVYLVASDDTIFNPHVCWAKLPLKAGDTWEVEDPAVHPRPVKFTVEKEEEIEVPAGKF